MSKKVMVPIAEGTEEIEAVVIVDVLRRAGADVTVASVNDLQVTASRGVKLVADCLIDDCADQAFDLIVLPGGMPGAENLRANETLIRMLIRQQTESRLLGAICAAPAVVLAPKGLLHGRKATAHPNHMDGLRDASASESRVVVDGNCVTSRAPGTAIEFALQLVELLFDKEKRAAVAEPMVL